MNQTIKNFWANRRQNAWIVVEIALVAILSFYFLDYFVVSDRLMPKVKDVTIRGDVFGSDHCPVILDVDLGF